MYDQIVIEELELSCYLGVTEEERSVPQRVTISVVLTPVRDFTMLRDDLRNAVDYQRVAEWITHAASVRPRRLIETLGAEIADEIFSHFPVQSLELHLRKFVIPQTRSVGIRLRRERPGTNMTRRSM